MKMSGLSLNEAIKFDRPIKHKNWSGFYRYSQGKFFSLEANEEKDHLSADEAVSSEWEIKEKEHYTREDVERAIKTLALYIPNGKTVAIEDALFQAEKGGH